MFVFNISKTFCLKEVFVTIHASFKGIDILIVEKVIQIYLNTPVNTRQRPLCEYSVIVTG